MEETKWKHFNIQPGHSSRKKALLDQKGPEVPMGLHSNTTIDDDRISPKAIFLKNISQALPSGCAEGTCVHNCHVLAFCL